MIESIITCDLCSSRVLQCRDSLSQRQEIDGLALNRDFQIFPTTGLGRFIFSTSADDAKKAENHLCRPCVVALYRLFSNPVHLKELDLKPEAPTPPQVAPSPGSSVGQMGL